MPPRKNIDNPDQGSFGLDGGETPYKFAEVSAPVVEKGPSVDLTDYYLNLGKALSYFGSMNKGTNYRNRFHESSPIVRTQFARQYRDPNRRFDESEDAKSRLESLARDKFAIAFGREALVASGIKTESAVDRSMDKYYKNFESQYGGIANAKARKSLQGKVSRRLEKLQDRIRQS